MKITKQDYDNMKIKIATVHTNDIQQLYKDKQFSDRRYRWDCFHATKCYTKELYDYLNDDHIDTALKNIINELNK